jgi:hypothetical protein
VLDWLDYRREHWPTTANPHLLVNRVTAVRTGPVSRVWITRTFWGLKATLDQLHVDRQLEESLVHGPGHSTWPRCSDSTRIPRSATPTPPGNSWRPPPSATMYPVRHEPMGTSPAQKSF